MKKLLVIALLLSSGYVFCCGDQKCGCSNKPKPRPQARPAQQTRCPHKPAGEKCPCENDKAKPADRR